MDTRNKIFAVVGTVAIIATAGITGVVLFTQQDSTATTATTSSTTTTSTGTTNTTTTTPSTSTSTSPTSSSASNYKDGTYSATVSYSVPRAQNSIKVTVVVSSGVISSVSTNNSYTDHESGEYIDRFESALSSSASGQSISSYRPSRIAGASLTTAAFSEALSDIASQAAA